MTTSDKTAPDKNARRLSPNAVPTLGILGGGQLARMIALAAYDMGLSVAIYAPSPEAPAFTASANAYVGAYEDLEKLAVFAQHCDVVTYEFENIPVHALNAIAQTRPVHPDPRFLLATQDRLKEKLFIESCGAFPTPYRHVETAADLDAALSAFTGPYVLKSRTFGYDGKNQVVIPQGGPTTPLPQALFPAVLEKRVSFIKELSVVAARDTQGNFQAFDPCENTHEKHILKRTIAPTDAPLEIRDEALSITRKIGEKLNVVGVYTVEFFWARNVRPETNLLVNEIAPRVHNSGHWTIEGARTSQFAQHVRAVCGWPLGSTERLGERIIMENLIGADVQAWREILADPSARLHLYGKKEIRPGRKMGHVTRVLTAF